MAPLYLETKEKQGSRCHDLRRAKLEAHSCMPNSISPKREDSFLTPESTPNFSIEQDKDSSEDTKFTNSEKHKGYALIKEITEAIEPLTLPLPPGINNFRGLSSSSDPAIKSKYVEERGGWGHVPHGDIGT